MSAEPQDIMEYIQGMEVEREGLSKQVVDICFFMKGGIDYNDAWALSFRDRERIVKRINKWNKEMSGDDTEYM